MMCPFLFEMKKLENLWLVRDSPLVILIVDASTIGLERRVGYDYL